MFNSGFHIFAAVLITIIMLINAYFWVRYGSIGNFINMALQAGIIGVITTQPDYPTWILWVWVAYFPLIFIIFLVDILPEKEYDKQVDESIFVYWNAKAIQERYNR